jgi:hypothetical protein
MSDVTLYEDPRAMEAVRLFTDPLLPTFGNKSASATQAGYKSNSCFHRKDVQEEIDRIIQQRLEQSEKVVEYVGTYAMDAARELVHQLSTGRDLEFIDMEEIERILDASDPDEGGKLLAAATRHNKVVLDAYEQRRKAAIEILRQKIGTPEQRIRVDKSDTPTPLEDMSDEQLDELNKILSEEVKNRKPQELSPEEDIPEAEAEIL